MKKYLNKSDFIRFIKCPTSAYYGWKGYTSNSGDDAFFHFLSEEAQSVGRAAHRLFAEGTDLNEQRPKQARKLSEELLQSESATLFKSSVISGSFMARPDVLIRKGSQLYLIEVKSKLGNLNEHNAGKMLFNIYGDIRAAWKDYVYDLAFQCAVLREAYPQLEVIPWLLLPEGNSRASDPENQVDLSDVKNCRSHSVLKFFNAAAAVKHVTQEVRQKMTSLEDVWLSGERPVSTLRYQCKNCEFRLGNGHVEGDGFHQCWGALANPNPHIFELNQLYSLRQNGNKQRLLADQKIEEGKTSLYDIKSEELHGEHSSRQATQLKCQKGNCEWIAPQLAGEIAQLEWPVAFLDFETTMAAVPKHKGVRPYETLPFQFSAHVLHRDGRYEHREWLNTEDRIPTLPFVKSLMKAMDGIRSILVYTDYENRILQESFEFLRRFGSESKVERGWIYELLNSGRIVDQHHWVHKHYFHPQMCGKSSIKRVMPSIWNSNPQLHEHSAFKDYFKMVDGRILNPYETLPAIVLNSEEVSVREGCGAMQVYREMIHGAGAGCAETKESLAGLLREYCKLDTASQWMIFEHWNQRLSK